MRSWDETLSEMADWQKKQFPKSTLASTLKHLRKELAELENEPTDIKEWVDILFFVVQGATKIMDINFFLHEVTEKLKENKEERTWPGPDAEGVYEHDRS